MWRASARRLPPTPSPTSASQVDHVWCWMYDRKCCAHLGPAAANAAKPTAGGAKAHDIPAVVAVLQFCNAAALQHQITLFCLTAALLYIVPFTLGAVALTAFARGETSQLLKFTDKSIMPGDKQRAEEQ